METLEKTLNVRLSQSTHSKLKSLTESTGRSQSWLTVEALESYLEQQSWQIAEVNTGIAEADRGEFATPADIDTILAKYAN
jgi:predicted transcriptional regulator